MIAGRAVQVRPPIQMLSLALVEIPTPVAHDLGPAAVAVIERGLQVGEAGDVPLAADL